MKKTLKSKDGKYHIKGKTYKKLIGKRAMVWHGTAYKTKGDLTKEDLHMNKWGKIVSKRKSASAKKEKRLEKHGYFAKKGQFGYVKKTPKHIKYKKSKTFKKKKY